MPKKITAGAFDIRTIIAALLGLYGIILLVSSFALPPGVNPETGALKNPAENLWSGIVMLVCAGIFIAWMKLSPITVAEPAAEEN